MSCKLFLVPEDVIQSWRSQQRNRQIDQPVETALSQQDKSMQTLLKKKTMSDYDKEKLYTQEMAKFVQMRDSRHPNETKKLPDDILESVPKMYRTKALTLLKYLQSDPDVIWDEQGRLVLKGKTISKSHIVDLLHDAMRYRKKSKRATGWQQLSHHLQEKNIPQELIGNDTWATPPSSVKKPSLDVASTPTRSGKATPKKPVKRLEGKFRSTVTRPIAKPKIKSALTNLLVTPGRQRPSKLKGKQKILDWIHI